MIGRLLRELERTPRVEYKRTLKEKINFWRKISMTFKSVKYSLVGVGEFEKYLNLQVLH